MQQGVGMAGNALANLVQALLPTKLTLSKKAKNKPYYGRNIYAV
jgi:hypothetical protein